MNRLLVSIVIPAYKAEKTIEQTLRSVFDQSFPNWEVILVNDCSPDNTLSVAAKVADGDNRVRMISNERNSGVSHSRNRGVEEAKGEWIAFLDSDDFWRPDKLEKQLALAGKTGADIVYTGYDYVDGEGNPLPGAFIVPEETSFSDMLKKNVMSTSGIMIRRNWLMEYPFRKDVAHEDLYEWLTLLKAGARAAGISQPLHTVRVSQRESRSGNKWKAAQNRMKLYRQMGLSVPQAGWSWLCYAVNGAKKYMALRRK